MSSSNPKGLKIARERIAVEKIERTGTLDLGRLGLMELPDELFELEHLEEINLGVGYFSENSTWKDAISNIGENHIEKDLALLGLLPNLKHLFLQSAIIKKGESLINIKQLKRLNCSFTEIDHLWLVHQMKHLIRLNCDNTLISSLFPVSELSSLQELYCKNTNISCLSEISGLEQLERLNCSNTKIYDLRPLKDLRNLEMLYCWNTKVEDISPLQNLEKLKLLNISRTKIDNITSLSQLLNLQMLDISFTKVTNIKPLRGLTHLSTFNCSWTAVRNHEPLSNLSNLKHYYCRNTRIKSLSALRGLKCLQEIVCPSTQVSDLSPLRSLNELERIDCYDTHIQEIPEWVIRLPKLKDLRIGSPRIKSIPQEVLSRDPSDNCLDRLRAHFDDLAKGSEKLTDVKLLVIGNGLIGKSQICRRLRDKEFDSTIKSTHGIEVHTIELPMRQSSIEGIETARLHLWDFGGQELYHGTHRLFLKSRSLFMIVWTPKSEPKSQKDNTHTIDGMTFRNHRLPYWVESVRLNAGNKQTLILVQNQCDKPEDREPIPPVAREIIKKFEKGSNHVHYSALKHDPDEFAMLLKEVRIAVQNQWNEYGIPKIGRGRLRVKNKIEEMQKADEHIRLRTMTLAEFDSLCQSEGDVSSSVMLLEYLDAAGVVIYRPDLFEDRIILDHGWAFQAIYAVMDRERTYREILKDGGVFVRSELANTVWANYPEADQELFLKLMQSCGICFIYLEAEISRSGETEYLAPDLLPGRDVVDQDFRKYWGMYEDPILSFEITLPFMHPGLMRGLICRVGREAQAIPTYWKDGFCFLDLLTSSHGLIEQILDEDEDRWSGRIIVSTRRGQAEILLARLHEWLNQILEQEIGPQKTSEDHVNWEINADQSTKATIGRYRNYRVHSEYRITEMRNEPMTREERIQLINELEGLKEKGLRSFMNAYYPKHPPGDNHDVTVLTTSFTQWAESGLGPGLDQVRIDLNEYCKKNSAWANSSGQSKSNQSSKGLPFSPVRKLEELPDEVWDKLIDIQSRITWHTATKRAHLLQIKLDLRQSAIADMLNTGDSDFNVLLHHELKQIADPIKIRLHIEGLNQRSQNSTDKKWLTDLLDQL